MEDEPLAYTTVTLRAPEYTGSLDDLTSDVQRSIVLSDISPQIARFETTYNPDDGYKVTLAFRGDEDDTSECLGEFYDAAEDWLNPTAPARIVTTLHPEPFEDTEVWPEDAVRQWMDAEGLQQYEVTANTPRWVPFSLISSVVQDTLLAILSKAEMTDDEIQGTGMDRTITGFPHFTIWASEGAVEAFRTADVERLVTETLDAVATEQVFISRWLQRIHAPYASLPDH